MSTGDLVLPVRPVPSRSIAERLMGLWTFALIIIAAVLTIPWTAFLGWQVYRLGVWLGGQGTDMAFALAALVR